MRTLIICTIIFIIGACSKDGNKNGPVKLDSDSFEAKFNDTLQHFESFAINANLVAGNKLLLYGLGNNGEELKIVFTGFKPSKNTSYSTDFRNESNKANVELYYYKPDSTTYYCHGDTGNCVIEITEITDQLIKCHISANARNLKNDKDILRITQGQLNASITDGPPLGILQMTFSNKILEFNIQGNNTGKGNFIEGKSYDNYETVTFKTNLSKELTEKTYEFAKRSELMPSVLYSPKGNTIQYVLGQESIDDTPRGSLTITKLDANKMSGVFYGWAKNTIQDNDSVYISNGSFFIKFKK